MSLIRPRAKVGPWLGFLLALGFGAVLLPIASFDLWLYDTIPEKGPAPVTLRTPSLGVYHNSGVRLAYEHRSVLVPRGSSADDPDAHAWSPKIDIGHSSDNAGPALAVVASSIVCIGWIDK